MPCSSVAQVVYAAARASHVLDKTDLLSDLGAAPDHTTAAAVIHPSFPIFIYNMQLYFNQLNISKLPASFESFWALLCETFLSWLIEMLAGEVFVTALGAIATMEAIQTKVGIYRIEER